MSGGCDSDRQLKCENLSESSAKKQQQQQQQQVNSLNFLNLPQLSPAKKSADYFVFISAAAATIKVRKLFIRSVDCRARTNSRRCHDSITGAIKSKIFGLFWSASNRKRSKLSITVHSAWKGTWSKFSINCGGKHGVLETAKTATGAYEAGAMQVQNTRFDTSVARRWRRLWQRNQVAHTLETFDGSWFDWIIQLTRPHSILSLSYQYTLHSFSIVSYPSLTDTAKNFSPKNSIGKGLVNLLQIVLKLVSNTRLQWSVHAACYTIAWAIQRVKCRNIHANVYQTKASAQRGKCQRAFIVKLSWFR